MGSRETASTSMSPYSVQTTENWSISLGRTEENQNLITYCYIPLQCQFVCQALADVHSQGMDEDAPIIKMTPFCVNANMNLAMKLHPRLKYDHVDMDMEDVLQVITDPFKKYDDLAITQSTLCVDNSTMNRLLQRRPEKRITSA